MAIPAGIHLVAAASARPPRAKRPPERARRGAAQPREARRSRAISPRVSARRSRRRGTRSLGEIPEDVAVGEEKLQQTRNPQRVARYVLTASPRFPRLPRAQPRGGELGGGRLAPAAQPAAVELLEDGALQGGQQAADLEKIAGNYGVGEVWCAADNKTNGRRSRAAPRRRGRTTSG